jgi:hypothetical protein
MPRIVYLPGLLVLVAEGIIWGLSAATGWGVWIEMGFPVLMLGVISAIIAFPAIMVSSNLEHRWSWGIASLCISALGVLFGFIFFLGAMSVGCGGTCFD